MSNGIGNTSFLLYFGPRIAFGFWLIWLVPHTIGALLSWLRDVLDDRYWKTMTEILLAYRGVADPYINFVEEWGEVLMIPTIIVLYLFFSVRAVEKGRMTHTA